MISHSLNYYSLIELRREI